MIEKKGERDVLDKVFFCPTGTPSSKNSRQWTGRRFLPSKATTKWRNETEEWWENNKEDFLKEIHQLEKPYLIGMHFVRKSKHKFDLINPMQTIQDEMTKYGFIIDDNTDEMIPFPLCINGKWHSYDKKNPGVYIKVIRKKKDIEDLTSILDINDKNEIT